MTDSQLDNSNSNPGVLCEEGNERSSPTFTELHPVPENQLGLTESNKYATFDEETPDNWVKRDKRLVKLTGKHPHNAESPLSLLLDQGFLTPQNLFFVRSHGAVPDVVRLLPIQKADMWSLDVCGMVRYPTTFTIAELKAQFEVVTFPITLVCAGNRRREQNVMQKGLGFNWGPGAISTALWTGVYLADILEHVQPFSKQSSLSNQKAPKHVIFEGADVELPQGRGPYGTSQPLPWARDRSKGILVCWEMNGEPLEPDHGFPLRIVVPGRVGGRSVKWLRKIEVSHQDSQHYYHLFDNKLFPTEVSPVQARREDHWWRDPRYIIQNLNVNSVIAGPAHDEVLPVFDSSAENEDARYRIHGYAYTGGGKRVNRVEISLDEGGTWLLADVEYPEDIYRQQSSTILGHHGKVRLTQRDSDECFCWCFWSFKARILDLKKSHSIQVRAMDDSLSLQSGDMYWSCMGFMNNWYFRIAIHTLPDGSLRFEHPTIPGAQPGGWMERMKNSGEELSRPDFRPTSGAKEGFPESPRTKSDRTGPKMVKDGVTMRIGEDELKATDKAWFVVNDQVYDATEYLDDHPGGASAITSVRGQDATDDFMAIHSPDTLEKLFQYHIAEFIPSQKFAVKTDADKKTNSLSTTSWMQVKLASIQQISPNTRIYRFTLPAKDQPLPLMPGQHIYVRLPMLKLQVEKSLPSRQIFVQRAYTPISPRTALGYVDLLVKIYLPCDAFPSGGKMSACYNTLKIGDVAEIKGPVGSFVVLKNNICRWKDIQWTVKEISMICGGSGITPMLQILRALFEEDERSTVHVKMINANRTEEDILCRKELEELQARNAEHFELHHTLTSPSVKWNSVKGRANKLLRELIPFSGLKNESLVLMCGPEGMVKTCKSELMNLGWDASQLVVF